MVQACEAFVTCRPRPRLSAAASHAPVAHARGERKPPAGDLSTGSQLPVRLTKLSAEDSDGDADIQA